MRLVELPVFPNPQVPETKTMLVNPDNVFFMVEAGVPTPIVDNNKQPVTREGTLLGHPGGGGLMVDMLKDDVIKQFGAEVQLLSQEAEGENGKPKSTTKNKGRVRKGTGNGKR